MGVTVVLHVIRSCGPTERHELEADGDTVHVAHSLLTSEDVVGLDVEIVEREADERIGGLGA